MPTDEEQRAVHEHFQRGLGESTRHNSLAYGYSVALTASFGMLVVLNRHPDVVDIFLFGIGASVPFGLLNAWVTRGFKLRVEDEPPIVLALGTSLGVLSVTLSIGAAALCGWQLTTWLAWLVAPTAATTVYLLATAGEFVLARGVRALIGVERLEDR